MGRARRARGRRRGAVATTVLAALALGGPAAAPAPAQLALRPCTPGEPARCARLTVPLDRTGALPGVVALHVRVLDPPAPPASARAPVIALAGGPGQAAAPLLEAFAETLGPALAERRLVAFDQRGTGASGPLRCAALARPGDLHAAVGACARELGPRRTAYGTAATVADLEALRAALGAARVVLYGTSYGTKVALDYAAAHPDRVEALVLDSVVPPAGPDPFLRATLASIPRVLGDVCRDACPFTRDPAADVAALVRRMAGGPLRGAHVDARGRRRPAAVGRAGLLALLLAGDRAPTLRSGFPAAVAAARRGDAAPLLRLAALARGGAAGGGAGGGDVSDALYLATTCADGAVPWPAGTPIDARAAAVRAAAAAIPDGAFAPFDRATLAALHVGDLCLAWPESPLPQPRLPLPPLPALLLSGDEDLRTPRADALAVAAQLPGAHVLAVPNVGHGVLGAEPGACARDAVVAFLADPAGAAPPAPCDPRPGRVAPAPLAARRLAAVPPPRGLAGRAARTVTAVDRTVDDAIVQFAARALEGLGDPRGFGGLRGGRAAVVPGAGLVLRRYAYVPGVAVSGAIPFTGARFALAVGGPAAPRGRLVVSRAGIAGTLGGRPVRASAAQLGWRRAGAAAAVRGRPPGGRARVAAAAATPAPPWRTR